MGTGEIGIPTLRWLAASDHELLGVYTQPDRPAGRGSKMTPPAIKVVAEELGLPVFQPERLRQPEVVAQVEGAGADLIVVMAYGQILSKKVLAAPRIACLNLHASILPDYRGAAPIQWSIHKGETETGVTTMLMDAGMDTGPMLLKEAIAIDLLDNAWTIAEKLSNLTAELLLSGEPAHVIKNPTDLILALSGEKLPH